MAIPLAGRITSKIKGTELISAVNTSHMRCVNISHTRLIDVEIVTVSSALNSTGGLTWQYICR